MPHRATLLLILLLTACGGAETKADPNPAASKGGEAASVKAEDKGPVVPVEQDLGERFYQVKSEGTLVPMASMSWGADGALRIGYTDAWMASVDVAGRKGKLTQLEKEPAPVIYVSPEAKLALVDAAPPRLIRVDDGREVLRMNHVPTHIESAGWHPSGAAFFATEPTGKLHIWKVDEEQLRRLPDETIQMFLNRQLPDYTGHLPEMAGPFVVRPDGKIIFGDSEGHLLRWDSQHPTDVELVIKLDAPTRSMASQGGLLAATSRSGQLRVASLEQNAFVPWSMKATGSFVTAHQDGEALIVSKDGEVRAVRAASGELIWSAKIGSVPACGLSMSRDGKTLAACFGDRVLLLKASDGAFVAEFGRYEGELRWL